MKKKEITLEEYEQAIETLKMIQNEKRVLKEMHYSKNYHCHLSLPETLDELLLMIKRENELLDRQIKRKKKEFFLALGLDLKIFHWIDMMIELFIDEQTSSLEMKDIDAYVISELPGFDYFYQEITNFILKKRANKVLEKYILNLQIQEINAINVKRDYEKKWKKTLKKVL